MRRRALRLDAREENSSLRAPQHLRSSPTAAVAQARGKPRGEVGAEERAARVENGGAAHMRKGRRWREGGDSEKHREDGKESEEAKKQRATAG